MKKLIAPLLLSIFAATASANIYIPTNIVSAVVSKHFNRADDDTVAAIVAYHEMIKAGSGVTPDGLYRVCTAGGMDIKAADGKAACDKFATELIKTASLDYYAVCGDDKGKTKGTEYCIEGVFENGWSKLGNGFDLNTGVMQAQAFAAAYIKEKYKIDSICSKNYRAYEIGNDDFIKCTSLDNKKFFEVRFDDVKESVDKDAELSQKSAICFVYGMNQTPNCGNEVGCPRGCIAKSAADCERIRNLANDLVYDVEFGTKEIITSSDIGAFRSEKSTACWLVDWSAKYAAKDGKSALDNLAKIDGLDNKHFYGIHSLNTNITDSVRQYVQGIKGKAAIVDCKKNTTKIPNINGNSDKDEILHCTVNGTPIDFVFDDTSEFMEYERRAGESGLGCAALGGTYTGEGCINIGKSQCDELITNLKKNCPSCSKPVWEEKNNRCYLPDSNAADNINFAAKIGGIATLTIGGIVLTVVSGGAAGGMAVAVILEAVGGVMEITAEIRLGTAAGKFLEQTAKCGGTNCGGCAEKVLSQLHTHIAQATDYQPIEVSAIDKEMARLLTCLPENSELSEKIINGILASNEGVTGEWTPDQILRATGVVLQLSTMIAGIGRTVTLSVQRGTGLIETSRALNRLERIAAARRAATKADDMVRVGKNIKDWKPGEDVAEYLDMQTINAKLKAIDAEHADDIAELERKVAEMEKYGKKTFGSRVAHTPEQEKEIDRIEDLIRNKEIDLLPETSKKELAILEAEANKANDAVKIYEEQFKQRLEIKALYEEADVLKSQGERKAAIAKIYEALERQMADPEFKKLRKIENTKDREFKDKLYLAINKVVPDFELRQMKEQLDNARAVGTDEYNKFINELEYNKALLEDAKITVGKEKNALITSVIPEEVKKVVAEKQHYDLVGIVAENDEIYSMAKNYDDLTVDQRDKFYKMVGAELNKKNCVDGTCTFGAYESSDVYNGGVHRSGLINNGVSYIGINENRDFSKGIEGVADIVKHEYGHHMDEVATNHNMTGETLMSQSESLQNKKTKIKEAELKGVFGNKVYVSVGDMAPTEIEQLQSAGIPIDEFTDRDFYRDVYRKEPTEASSWYIGGYRNGLFMNDVEEARKAAAAQ